MVSAEPVLELSHGLSDHALGALADLEKRTLAADGGRLKLEWRVLQERPADKVQDVLWWADDQLLGFVGSYSFGRDPELTGMVDPQSRRQGIGTALVDAALGLCRDADAEQVLFVVPRPSAAGKGLAERYGGTLDHSEHALVLSGEPADGPSDPAVTIRPANNGDIPGLTRLFTDSFGWCPPDIFERLQSDSAATLLFERDGAAVGTMRTTLDDRVGGVYGFCVDPALQGRGIGRDVLRRVCRQLRADGAERVTLEVEVDNDHALGLYTSLGFEPVITEDYYKVRT